MIYTVENTMEVGRPVRRVVDANGQEWSHCVRVDDQTGEITRCVTELRESLTYMVTDERGNPRYETLKVAAPVLVEFYAEDDDG